ncbi:hypothetical protein ABBQ38_004597 [Trebouxia sp. C0009 RCD-2024]
MCNCILAFVPSTYSIHGLRRAQSRAIHALWIGNSLKSQTRLTVSPVPIRAGWVQHHCHGFETIHSVLQKTDMSVRLCAAFVFTLLLLACDAALQCGTMCQHEECLMTSKHTCNCY